jgi:tetratricopeptide (TPR) repeat protein
MSWMDWIRAKVTGKVVAQSEPPPREHAEPRASERATRDPAIAKLDAAIAALPDGPKKFGLYWERGLAYKKLDDLDRALADFDRVGKVLPALADVHGHRGECLLRQHKYEAAIDSLDRAIALLPRGTGEALAKKLATPPGSSGVILAPGVV